MKNASSILLLLLCILLFITGCATQGSGQYAVGPGSDQKAANLVKQSSGLSVIIPVFDPGIPDNPDEYERRGVWPELRRAEANRFAVNLKTAVEDTGKFEGVRVAPTTVATGHLYVSGKIVESNGEDVKLQITVVDISGAKRLSKTYSHRVKEYSIEAPRMAGKDLYEPIFDEIAADIAKTVGKMSDRSVANIQKIEVARYGEAFSPDYFSQFISTNKRGQVKLVSAPALGDSMVGRIDVIRVKDQMFLDSAQADYLSFKQEMDTNYFSWQRQAFVESKAAREAQAKSNAKTVLGALAIIGGAAMVASADSYDNDTSASADSYDTSVLAGAAVATAGVVAVFAGIENSKEAKQHKESLNELGKSLNIELAPRVMKLENQEVELEGTLEEQYVKWRSFLKALYVLEATPERTL